MVARETPDSFTTSSIVVLPSPNRSTHRYVAPRRRSRNESGSAAWVMRNIVRHNRVMPPHDSWVKRDADVVWHGFTQMATYADNRPVMVDRAEGHELIDVDGRRYL